MKKRYVIFFILIAIGIISGIQPSRKACENKGGVLVQQPWGVACVATVKP